MELVCDDIGVPTKLRIGHNNAGFGAGWLLDGVVVTSQVMHVLACMSYVVLFFSFLKKTLLTSFMLRVCSVTLARRSRFLVANGLPTTKAYVLIIALIIVS